MTQQLRNVTDLDLAYAAGFIDGEGCVDYKISFYESKLWWGTIEYHSARIRANNTNKEVLVWLQAKFGGNIETRKVSKANKPQWCWSTQKKKTVTAILNLIEPYLIVKREQVREILKGYHEYSAVKNIR